MAELSHSLVEVVDAVKERLEKARLELGVADVFYGDDSLIPEYPAIMVDGAAMVRSLASGSTRRYRIDFIVYVWVLFGKVQEAQVNRRESEALAERVEAKLHEGDNKWDGLVVFGHVARRQPGRVLRAREGIVKTTRLTWEAQSREVF